MGVGYVIAPFFFILFYILPIALCFSKRRSRGERILLIAIPTAITLLILIVGIRGDLQYKERYQPYPQMNKITFVDPVTNVRDSIIALQKIMEKFPGDTDFHKVSYLLEKANYRHNNLYYNSYRLGAFEQLAIGNNLHDYQMDTSTHMVWERYKGPDLTPFNELSDLEIERFIHLVEFFDRNYINGAELSGRNFTLDYNDSLRINQDLAFRFITLDTSDFSNREHFTFLDGTNGVFLMHRCYKN